jgi:hypothetical protein
LQYNSRVNSEKAMTAGSEGIRQQLEGIIALLLALAALAERASRAPLSVRLRVLSILEPAEFAAQHYVYGQTGRPVLLPAHDDAVVDDSEGLAARFRWLAFALASVAVRLLAGRRARAGIRMLRTAGDAAGVARAGSWVARPFDTS